MHRNDFRDDLEPTHAQYRDLTRGLAWACGEKPPATRREATEFLLRLRDAAAQARADRTAGAAAAPPNGGAGS